uniref:Uncharacterized protein n=1 Tax=Oryza punctata TaxID=4537 RepID=A0A0E0LA52_ORYPU
MSHDMAIMEPSSSSSAAADDQCASAVVTPSSAPPSGRCVARIRLPPAWTPEEDAALERLAMENGSRHWCLVAAQMPRKRSPVQCRDRWRNHLARDVFHRPFTAADDDELARLILRPGGGDRWKDISRAVHGRSSRSVKRRWMEIGTSDELLRKLWHPRSSMLSPAGQDTVMHAVDMELSSSSAAPVFASSSVSPPLGRCVVRIRLPPAWTPEEDAIRSMSHDMAIMEPSSSSSAAADDQCASAVVTPSSAPPSGRCVARIRLPPAWTPEEDAALERLAMENGSRHWCLVAAQMPRKRSPVQCRDRWRNHLARDVFHRPFTAADDDELARLILRPGGGDRWKDISRAVHGRSSRSVKRRWMEIGTSDELLRKLWHPRSSMLSPAGQDTVMHAVDMELSSSSAAPVFASSSVSPPLGRCVVRIRLPPAWTPEEDAVLDPFTLADDDELTRLILRPGSGDRWKDISRAVHGRSSRSVKRRWMEISTSDELLRKLWHPRSSMLSAAGQDALSSSSAAAAVFASSSVSPPLGRCVVRIRLPPAWTPEDDAVLERLARENGSRHWCRVAAQMPSRRSPVQCRDRWRDHLARNVFHRPFTATDDAELARLCLRLDGDGRWKDISRAVHCRSSRAMKRRWRELRKSDAFLGELWRPLSRPTANPAITTMC